MENKLEKLKSTSSRSDFAKLLGVRHSFLNYVLYAKSMGNNYYEFEIPKKSGGVRNICAPNENLKSIQRRLAELLLDSKNLIHVSHLSHGFERKRNIITNAQRHIRKKNVLNIDLENFFDSINFGRVRGFFIKNANFQLQDEVATTIAQIACYNNKLPQGSPCSPVIANLIASTLDIYLNTIAKKHGCSYSRYADDITISTNKKSFPAEFAKIEDAKVILGDEILAKITRAGFSVNNRKIRVQFRDSRQDVTGIIVNKKVNTRSEYWRVVRAMANNLFKKGFYIIDDHKETELAILEGKLSFIDSVDKFNNFLPKPHKEKPYYQLENTKLDYLPKFNTREKTYSKFLYYKFFHANKSITILTEGETDVIYLKCAFEGLKEDYPQLLKEKNDEVIPAFTFFKNNKKMKYFLDLEGGSASLKKFVQRYCDHYKFYSAKEALSPVILILDNDIGQNDLLKLIEKELGTSKEKLKEEPFIRICHNLFLILTPLSGGKDTMMEDLFEESILTEIIEGKIFNKSNNTCTSSQYGKVVFAQKVIRQKRRSISFDSFRPIFDSIVEIVEAYKNE